MYNRTGQLWLESSYLAVGEGKVLFSTIAKPAGMFGLGIAPKEKFLGYSTQSIFFDNKTRTWKRGYSRRWYVRKELHHGWVNIWTYVKTCISFYIFCFLFIYLSVWYLIILLHFYICNV